MFHLWTLSRVVWAFGFLFAFIYDIELLEDSKAPVLTPILLFLLLFFCEILPILTMLDYSYVPIVGFEAVARRDLGNLSSTQESLLRHDDFSNQDNSSLSGIITNDDDGNDHNHRPSFTSLDHVSQTSSRGSDRANWSRSEHSFDVE